MIKLIGSVLILLTSVTGFSQGQIVKWQFTAENIRPGDYRIHLSANVPAPWHIYSTTSPADAAFPTKVIFNKNPLFSFQGSVTEEGKMVNKFEEVFNETVKYYEGQVNFIQQVKLKVGAKTKLTGTVEFMICNEGKCLAPRKLPFTVYLGLSDDAGTQFHFCPY